MKQLLLLCVFVPLTTVALGQAAAQTLKKLNWLEGTWKKVNSRSGRSGYEKWAHVAGSWSGSGVTLRGTDTVFSERLALLIKDDNLYYVADVAENKAPTYFKITAISAAGFTCDNPEHDFPKKIVYQRMDRKLKVTVSGDGKAIDFLFEKE